METKLKEIKKINDKLSWTKISFLKSFYYFKPSLPE